MKTLNSLKSLILALILGAASLSLASCQDDDHYHGDGHDHGHHEGDGHKH